MSYESSFWKNILKSDVRYLSKKTDLTYKEIGEKEVEHCSRSEIKIMSTAFAIRKLCDSGKLPDKSLDISVRVARYERNIKETPRVFVNIEKEYKLSHKSLTTLRLRRLCNIIIHSYVLEV